MPDACRADGPASGDCRSRRGGPTTLVDGEIISLRAPAGWRLVGTGDVNGADGAADFVWHHADDRVAVWLMDGTTITDGAIVGTAPAGWSLAGPR